MSAIGAGVRLKDSQPNIVAGMPERLISGSPVRVVAPWVARLSGEVGPDTGAANPTLIARVLHSDAVAG